MRSPPTSIATSRGAARRSPYKLGELQTRHRREAEEKLGAKFDQRRFHDTILAIGSVPLPVLEEHIAPFIASELAKRGQTGTRRTSAPSRSSHLWQAWC